MTTDELTEKWALVGGASQGIGEAIATVFAQAGARVILMSRSSEKLEVVRKSLPHPERHRIMPLDLENLDQVNTQVAQLVKLIGTIEIVVNNSGGPPSGSLVQVSSSEFEKFFRAHVVAGQIIMQNVLPGMKEKRFGRIINIISTSVKVPIPQLGLSNTIRAAMASWAKSLSHEVGPFGVTVNNILPGYTKTPRLSKLIDASAEREKKSSKEIEETWMKTIPVGRFAEPSEIAQAALYLASQRAAYITGTQITVDGGRTGTL